MKCPQSPRHCRGANVVTFLDCMQTRGSQIGPLLFFTFYFRGSEWLWGPNWLQTWLRLKLSLWKWQGADLPAWQWAIGHHSWQMCSGTKVAGCWWRQNAFSHSSFPFFLFQPLPLPAPPPSDRRLIKIDSFIKSHADRIISFLKN